MHRLSYRLLVAKYAVASTFLLLVAVGDLVTAVLAPRQAAALRLWASTNVVNLHDHPMPALALSAFLPSESSVAWLALIALVMFGANKALGNLRLALVGTAGHVIGTAVSEGILAFRIDHRALSSSFAHITDIGPSYVVVAAIVAAAAFGSWPARGGAITVFATLVFVGHIFAGLTSLNVTAVGHLTALVTAAVLAAVTLRTPSLAQVGARATSGASTTRQVPRVVPQAIAVSTDPGIAIATWSTQPGQDAAPASPDQPGDDSGPRSLGLPHDDR